MLYTPELAQVAAGKARVSSVYQQMLLSHLSSLLTTLQAVLSACARKPCLGPVLKSTEIGRTLVIEFQCRLHAQAGQGHHNLQHLKQPK